MRGKAKIGLTPHVRPGDDSEERTCPACGKEFRTAQGTMTHLSAAKSCRWYRKGKNVAERYEPPVHILEDAHNEGQADDWQAGERMRDEEDAEDFYDIMENRDLFQFNLPSPVDPYGSDGNVQATSSHAGPSSATPGQRQPALDDDEDTRVEDENVTAGRVIRMSKTVVETWKAYFSDADDGSTAQGDEDRMDVDGDADNPGEYPQKDPNMKWKPFASELDWRVAMWAVREDVGQNSLNRLLSIPGVCVRTAISLLVPVLMNIVLCRWLKSWSLASRTYANSS